MDLPFVIGANKNTKMTFVVICIHTIENYQTSAQRCPSDTEKTSTARSGNIRDVNAAPSEYMDTVRKMLFNHKMM